MKKQLLEVNNLANKIKNLNPEITKYEAFDLAIKFIAKEDNKQSMFDLEAAIMYGK